MIGSRTNAAQFMIGRAALGRQLHALGLLRDAKVPFDCDAANLLTEMYHDHGDTIALQYGGSNLVNTIDSYKIKQWSSHSRDMIEGIRRYYANSFSGILFSFSRIPYLTLCIDAEKQKAIDLYLGVHDIASFQSHAIHRVANRSYIHWYTDENLQNTMTPEHATQTAGEALVQLPF